MKNFWLAIVVIVLIAAGTLALKSRKSSTTTAKTVTTTNDTTFVPTYPCTTGGTALAALQAKYPVDTKDTSFGKQVMGINHDVATEKQYWSFNIDGQAATVGADAYQCKGTETITWNLVGI